MSILKLSEELRLPVFPIYQDLDPMKEEMENPYQE